MRKYVLLYLLSLGFGTAYGQVAELILNSPLSGTHNKVARDAVIMNPGFSYTASAGNTFTASTNKNLFVEANYLNEQFDPDDYTLNTSLPAGYLTGTYSVTPTGGAAYQIPIFTPKGIGNMAPQMAITYNSQAGNGILGMGFNLSGLSVINKIELPYYARVSSPELLPYLDSQYALDGNRLVLVSGVHGEDGATYKTENETYSQIILHDEGESVPTWFEVSTKDGKTIEYTYYEPFVSDIYGYYISKIIDQHGNYLIYQYGAGTGSDPILTSIKYTWNDNVALQFCNEMKFYYDKRSDANKTGFRGGTLQSTMILREIEVLVNSEVVRKYKFSYFLDLYTHLNIVNEYDQAGTMVSSSMIKWGDRGPLYSLINQPDLDLADSDKELIGDFNGDGKYDLIVFPDKLTYLPTDTWTIYLQEDGEYVQAADGLLGDYFKSMITGDINNDGIDEFIFKFHNNMAPGFTRFKTYKFGNNTMQFLQTIFDYTSTESGIAVQLADFDGNGVVDYLFTEGDNDVKSIIGLVSTVPLLYQPDLVFISDFNGDGRSDIATVDGNYLNVYKYDLLSTQFIKIITNYTFTYYDKIFPGDFNGDGLTDILTVDNGINIPNCFTDQVKTKILLSTGSTFINVDGPTFYQYLCNVPDDPQTEQTIASQWDVGFIINDLNHDGKSDMLATTSVHQVTYLGGGILNEYDEYFHDVYLSSGLAFQHYDIDLQGLLFASYPYDINFDGVTDFSLIFEGEESRSANFLVDDIRNFALGITNNANLKVSFGYESLMDSNVYYEEEEQFPANVKKISLPARLLSSILVVDKNLQRNLDHKKFRYSNLKVHTQGKGILGFTSMSTKDLMSSDSSIVHYELDPTFYVPFPEETKIYKNNTLVSSTENTNLFIALDNGKRFATYTSEAINSDFIDNTGQYQLMSLDTDGNITVKEVGYLNSAGDTIKTIKEQYSSFDTFGNPGSITVISTNSDSTITRQKTMAYNSAGQLTSSTVLFGSSPSVISSFTYDTFGNLLTNSILCDSDSRTNSYVYEPIKARFVIQSTNSLGQTTFYDFDSSTGLPYKVTDHNNLSTFYKYDNIGRTFRITSPDSTVTNITRGWSNNALGLGELYSEQVSMAGKPTEISYYDISGKELRSKVESFDGRFLVSDVEYDSLGRLTKKYLPYFEGDARPQYTIVTYDTYNRPLTETVTPNNLVTVYSYSPLKTSMTQAGRSYETEYDAAGMKTKVTEPGGTINYKYNPEGKTIEIESPSGSTFIEYDAYGNQKKLIDLDAGNIEYIYNGLGMLLEQTDAKGNKVIIDHDTGGRTVSETWNTGLTKSYEYFPTSGMLKRTFTSEGAESSYTYDNYLRVLSIIQKVDDQNTFTRTFEYNERGELIKAITNSIVTETYTYNARGYQDQILVNGSLVWKAYSQNKYGIIDNFKLRNNTENTILTYDQYGFPESIQTVGATTLQNWTYSFNPLTGNMTSRSGLKSNGTIASENYTYDNQNRLLTYGIGQNVMTMSYDTTNILYKSDVGEYNYGISVHAPESITNPTLLLDALPDQLVTYTVFDKIKTLTHTVDSLTVKNLSWIYGPDDQRIKQVYKLNSQTLSTKYYAFGDYEKEITPQGFRELYYINSPSGTVAIIEIKPDSVNYYYLHTDLLGSFDVITKANGSIKERNNFDPWGRRRNPIDWSYNSVVLTLFTGRGFTGHEHLIEFDLINMNGRVYDPLLAMFLSPDNFLQASDKTQNFNRYAYCLNNPLAYTDPSGEFIFSIFLGPVGAIIDAACWSAAIDAIFQGFRIATGKQDKFNWAELGGAAIGGGVGGIFAFAAPAFIQPNLFVRYSTKALYAGLSGASGAGALMLGRDLLDNGVIDYSAKDYLKGMAFGGGLSMGISLAGSAYRYGTWDKYSDIEKLNILKKEFGNNIEIKNSVYLDGKKVLAGRLMKESMTAKVGDPFISSEVLANKSVARSALLHEIIHDRDLNIQMYKIIFGKEDALSFLDYLDYTEQNAYYSQLLQTSRTTPGWWWSQTARYARSWQANIPNTYRIWQLILNLF